MTRFSLGFLGHRLSRRGQRKILSDRTVSANIPLYSDVTPIPILVYFVSVRLLLEDIINIYYSPGDVSVLQESSSSADGDCSCLTHLTHSQSLQEWTVLKERSSRGKRIMCALNN